MPTNYDNLMAAMSPEMMTYLLSQGIFINSCSCCSLHAASCDHKCDNHILEWLKSSQDEKSEKLIKALKVAEEVLG